MEKKQTILTIDGPSGSGKSTLSRLLAGRLRFTFLDTGAMYRAVGLKTKQAGTDLADEKSLALLLRNLDIRLLAADDDTHVFLDGEDVTAAIRTAEMGMVASKVSAIPAVREKLTDLQRNMARFGPIVAEGRDMGTVVFPHADYKFYLDASPEERARRRTEQLHEKGQDADYKDILQQIINRDHNDSSRAIAPLKPAADAEIIDSSTMSIEDVLSLMMSRVKTG